MHMTYIHTPVRLFSFRGTSLGIYLMTTISMAAFAFTLDLDLMWVVFVTGGMLG